MKTMIRLQCIGVLALIIALSIPSDAVGFAPGWSIQTVDSAGDAGRYTSIALDSSGRPHISYYDSTDRDLKYAKWTGSAWSIQTVDWTGYVGTDTSIALDSSGNPHISYYDAIDGTLKYAKWNGIEWNIQTVDSAGNVGSFTSIALDSSGKPHISYYDQNKADLKYAKWNGSAWYITTVDFEGDVGRSTSIALDASDNPRISYADVTNSDLKYAEWVQGKFGSWFWKIQTVDSAGSVGSTPSLEIDSSGNPHISYYDYTYRDLKYTGDLKYAKRTGGVWMNQTVDSAGTVGLYSSLALDSSDNPHISYWDYTNSNLKYAEWNGSAWSRQTIDLAGNVGEYTSIALDSSGKPRISYYDRGQGDLRYAKFTGSAWSTQTVDSVGGTYTSIAIDSSDNPHISYQERWEGGGPFSVWYGNLKYSKWTGSEWNTQTVDPAGTTSDGYTGAYTSIALDASGNPHISYYSSSPWVYGGDLKYARWNGSAWVNIVIDSLEVGGGSTSIALDSSGNPHISYYDAANGDLKYAEWVRGPKGFWFWNIQTVDSSGYVYYTSLALDSSGNPHISYTNYTNPGDVDLKYAKWTGSTWSIQTVDSGYMGYDDTSLALDSSGNPHISYYNATNGDLKYAKWNGSAWYITTVDSAGDVGVYASIAIDSHGNPHISYYNWSGGDLKYASWTGTGWVNQTVDSEGDVGSYISLAFDSSDNAHISYHDFSNDDLKYAFGPASLITSDTTPPGVADPTANQSVIPDDTDYIPLWGETAQLNVTVADASNVSVTVNLSEIGGASVKLMTNIGGNIYSSTTNASAGTPPKIYNLTVNATDSFGNSNTSIKIPLRVMMNGDATGDGRRNIGDALRLANNVSYPGDARYLLSSIYVAEVTGDGRITIGDALRLANNVSYPGDPRYILK